MTREDAKHMRLFTQWQEEEHDITWKTTTSEIINDHELIVDKIYDDFEKKICSNCKDNVSYKCNANDSIVVWIDTVTFPDFGCSQFTLKIKG